METNRNSVERRTAENLRLEYQECGSESRFLMGVRFTFFATFIAFSAVLMGAYQYVWAGADVFGSLQPYVLFTVSLFGIITAFVAVMIETRNIVLADMCNKRSAALETKLDIDAGIHQQISDWAVREGHTPFTQTFAVYILYDCAFLVWVALLIYSTYRVSVQLMT